MFSPNSPRKASSQHGRETVHRHNRHEGSTHHRLAPCLAIVCLGWCVAVALASQHTKYFTGKPKVGPACVSSVIQVNILLSLNLRKWCQRYAKMTFLKTQSNTQEGYVLMSWDKNNITVSPSPGNKSAQQENCSHCTTSRRKAVLKKSPCSFLLPTWWG